ncbi:MAG TPA: hypothetical protein DC058_06225 [Planctomycetaceae bacterium]|nr:hypothetical protein [Planctomycetaceae bacterium]HBC60798.1 hypothetical protein [Planctomycetaceae bacterium]
MLCMSAENRTNGRLCQISTANRRQHRSNCLIRQTPDCGPLLPPLEIGRRKIRLGVLIGKVNAAD